MRLPVEGRDTYAYTGSRPFDPALPTIVFVHGAANDHSVFTLQSRYFAHHRRNVLAIDLPGHGRSAGDALTSVEQAAHWMAQLLDAAQVDRAALVGHSYGSLITLETAARFPDRVSKLALIGAAVPMVVTDILLDAAKANDHVAYELITGWSYSAVKQLGGNQVPGMWMTGNAMRLMERTPRDVLYTDLLACQAYAQGAQAARSVRCPALLILAARDLMTPVQSAQPLIDGIAQVLVKTLPDCGHSLMQEQPDAVLDALAAFL